MKSSADLLDDKFKTYPVRSGWITVVGDFDDVDVLRALYLAQGVRDNRRDKDDRQVIGESQEKPERQVRAPSFAREINKQNERDEKRIQGKDVGKLSIAPKNLRKGEGQRDRRSHRPTPAHSKEKQDRNGARQE